jgi:hypothetical protein
MADPQTCAFETCDCKLSGEQVISREGKQYCSERCADGRGCDHAECNCGEFPEAEPMI